MNTIKSVLSKVGKTLKPRENWMDNSVSEYCLLCDKKFGLRVRRHHCRFCFRLICGTCSPHTLRDEDDTIQRACIECYRLRDTRAKNNNDNNIDNDYDNDNPSLSILRSDTIKVFVHQALELEESKDAPLLNRIRSMNRSMSSNSSKITLAREKSGKRRGSST